MPKLSSVIRAEQEALKDKELFAGGRWTSSRFQGFIRSALRRAWMKWPPKLDTLASARRPSELEDKRSRWEYKCNVCKKWFRAKEVQVDHIHDCGSLDDMNAYIGRMFCEEAMLQVSCKGCHRLRNQIDREQARIKKLRETYKRR